MKTNQKKCEFCQEESVNKDRIIMSKNNWRAFVPNDPEIFGHILVTTKNFNSNCPRKDPKVPNCPLEISEVKGKENIKKFKEISDGLIECSNILKKIQKVEKVYVIAAGETPKLHVHYHLIPRYEFTNEKERKELAEKINLKSDDPKWVEFYNWPTRNFEYKQDFRYLGEVEAKYNECRDNEYYPIKPSEEIIAEITKKIREFANLS